MMRRIGDAAVIVMLAILVHVTTGESTNDGDDLLRMHLQEEELTIVDWHQFEKKSINKQFPFSPNDVTSTSWQKSPSEDDGGGRIEDDVLVNTDRVLNRYRRQANLVQDVLYSGDDDPCATNATLCSAVGQRCVFDGEKTDGYYCACLDHYELQGNTCVEIPESKRLYLTTGLEVIYHASYANSDSVDFADFTNNSQEALAQEFIGLEGYKTLLVTQLRNDGGKTTVVYIVYFTVDTTVAVINNVAARVLVMEAKRSITISGSQLTFRGFTGIFSSQAATSTNTDVVDWCSSTSLYICADANSECNDGGVPLRYSCVCKTNFVDVFGECVDSRVSQRNLYPFGVNESDYELPKTDDGFLRVDVAGGFPVGVQLSYRLYIAANGFIAFNSPATGLSFRMTESKAWFCPYLTDIDISRSDSEGHVFYHVYDDRVAKPDIFDRVDSEINEYMETTNYRSKFLLVVTWYKASPYASRDPMREQVTVQAVLVSDGTLSYGLVMYLTNAINWDYRPYWALIIGLSQGRPQSLIQQQESNSEQAFQGLDRVLGNTGRRGTWVYEIGEAYSANVECLDWYMRNRQFQWIYNLMSFRMPMCPCVTSLLRRSVWVFSSWNGNVICFRLSLSRSRWFFPYSRTCCYRMFWFWGTLIRSGPNAGGLITKNPAYRQLRYLYYREDVHPHDVCCRQADPGYCQYYTRLRPVGFCFAFSRFGISFMLGDPHVVTMDGKEYTFNGWGEYTMSTLQTENVTFTLQGRTEKAITENGTVINATVFTAFAATNGVINVTVSLDTNRTYMIIFVNDKDYSLNFKEPDMMIEELDYTLLRQNDSVVVLLSDISLTITPGLNLLDIEVSIPNDLKNISKGLLGNFNGDPNDDFVLPNGTILSTNMTEREIFYNFGQVWAIDAADSVFRYPPRKGPADYQHPLFVPVFLDEAPPEKLAEAQTLCKSKENLACIYDFIATGSSAIAQATGSAKDTADSTGELLKNTVPEVTSNETVVVSAGDPVVLQLVGTDADGDNVTYFVGDDASGAFTLNNVTGEVKYNASASSKNDSLEFYVIDSKNAASPVTTIQVVFCPSCSDHGQCDTTQPRPALSSETYRYATCICEPYYDGDDCEIDLDGCAEDPCIPGQNCTDVDAETHRATNVSYNCSDCPSGFAIIEGKCGDVNECNVTDGSENPCPQICTNTDGSYLCSCTSGFRLGQDGRSCLDINECAEKTASCEQICINTDGGYNCSCEPGYIPHQSSNGSCEQDPATLQSCSSLNCSQGCKAENGSSPQCFCFPGYKVNTTDSAACEDEDECDLQICSQTCSNSIGSFSCSCYPGYKLQNDGSTCLACTGLRYGLGCLQTCSCNGRSTRCDPVHGCVCRNGWTGEHCQNDVNECVESPELCGQAQEICVNTAGSYRCQCAAGYERNATTSQCQDIDECRDDASVPNTCSDLQICRNTAGSYFCECNPGYVASTSSNCTDINECTEGVASCEQVCINNDGSYTCDCNLGFVLAADRFTCLSEDDVCNDALTCSQLCTLDDADNPYCFCRTGFRLGTDSQTCFDIDECQEGTAGCSHTCSNEPGSFTCSCPVGTRLANDQKKCQVCETGTYGRDCSQSCSCGLGSTGCDPAIGCRCSSGWTGARCDQDINECATVNVTSECAEQNAQCENFPGGYRCSCASGYYKNVSGSNMCEDINECSNNPCSQRCENSAGSYRCLCNAGFTLNGDTCEDENECSLVSTNRCTQLCLNTVGSYVCVCDEVGFTLDNDGFTCNAKTQCSDVTVCAISGNGGCVVNATGYDQCFCNSGYKLNSSNDCVLEERNWCGEAGCQHTCTNTSVVPYFLCSCPVGYELNVDGRTCRECAPDRWGDDCMKQCTCDNQRSESCNSTDGTCTCKPGWEDSNCTSDIVECPSPPVACGANSQCQNTLGSYICVCQPGYFQSSDGSATCQQCAEGFFGDCSQECPCNMLNTQSCDHVSGRCVCKNGWAGSTCEADVNECTTSSPCTGDQELCRNTNGSFECFCGAGYQYNSSKHCVDENECLMNKDNCSHTCVNTDGGFICSCPRGFHGDIYNCSECPEGKYGQDCSSNCTCVETGTVSCDKVNGTCYCKAGILGVNCQNGTDECSANPSPCPANTYCTNFFGGHNCTCNAGYHDANSDGNCTECPENKYGQDCSSNCTCQAEGTISCDKVNGTCYCKAVMQGVDCQTDIDECIASPSPCPANTFCTNFVGGHNCTCNAGYHDANSDGNCTDVNECDTNNGGCQQVCNNTMGSVACSCRSGFFLSSDKSTCRRIQVIPLGLTIDVTVPDLSDILANKTSPRYISLRDEVRQQLFDELKKTVVALVRVIINSMKSGSLIVDASAEVDESGTTDVAATMAKAVVQLDNVTFQVSGQQGQVKEVTINNQTVDDVCKSYTSQKPCPSNSMCRVNSDTGLPSCQLLIEDDDKDVIIGLSVGIPLFFITAIIIGVLIYIHVKGRKTNSSESDYDDNQSQLSSVFARRIAPRGAWRADAAYKPDTVSSGSSENIVWKESHKPEYDMSPWSLTREPSGIPTLKPPSRNIAGRELSTPYEPFVIKRPTVQPYANPAYSNVKNV